GRDARAIRDELLARDELARAVDGVDGKDQPPFEIERGEAACGWIAAQHDLVIARRQPCNLQLQVVLIGPEPRHLRLRCRGPKQSGRRDFRLVDRIRHGLQAHALPMRRERMVRAVAGRDDVRIGRPCELVDDDAVQARKAGAARELDVGLDADADDRDVAGEFSAVAGLRSAVRASSSTTMPFKHGRPARLASSTLGSTPTPTIATSQANFRPSLVSTAVTREGPWNALTPALQ